MLQRLVKMLDAGHKPGENAADMAARHGCKLQLQREARQMIYRFQVKSRRIIQGARNQEWPSNRRGLVS